MRIDARLGSFEDVVASAPQHAETLGAIRALVAEHHPDAHEGASSREGWVWWGWGPAKNTAGYAWCMPYKSNVNLGFMQGASLRDPEGRLEGTGKAMRHVKVTNAGDLADRAIRDLLIAARDERRVALQIKE